MMANFKYFNIQLLPMDRKHGNIGPEGYRRLFEALRKEIRSALQSKRLPDVAAPLSRDMYFSPFRIDVFQDDSRGEFLKFDHVSALQDIYTGEVVQKVESGRSTKRYSFDFVFSYESHVLALEQAKGVPSMNPLMEALDSVFRPVAERVFPEHRLTITSLTESDSIDVVWEAEGYKRLEVDVTFSNSDAFDDESVAELEEELKDKNVHAVEHVEKSAGGGAMSDLTEIGRTLVGLAMRYGDATIRYIKDGASEVYHMKKFPVRISVVHEGDDTDDDYFRKIALSIKEAVLRSRPRRRQ